MSGPIVPPLEVTEVDGSPDGRPITKIIVSNGDLSISGRTATIDTSGSATTPGGADTNVQYNNAGAFGGAADFTFTGIGGADPILTITNSAGDAATFGHDHIKFDGGADLPTISSTVGDDGLILYSNLMATGPRVYLDSLTSPSVLNLQNAESGGTINIETTTGSGGISVVSVDDIDLKVSGSNIVEVQNATTNTDSVLSIMGNGTGDAKLDLQNASKRVWVLCDENKKLKIQGGAAGNTFIFDVSSASGGITFPDSTVQTTAASGGGGGMAPFVATAMATAYDTFLATAAAPYPNNILSSDNQTVNYDTPFYQPFVCPADMDIVNIQISVISSAAATNCDVAIYSADAATGSPSTKLTTATFDVSSTGYKTTVLGSSESLTAGTLYYLAYVRDASNNFVLRSHPGEAIATGFVTGIDSFNTPIIKETGTDNALPATTTTTNLESKYDYNVIIGLGV